MSNPAVIKLASINCGDKFSRLDIEDNIGESVHIHLDNLRLDFSISEFLQIAEGIESILSSHPSLLPPLDLKAHSLSFLSDISSLLPLVKSETIKTIPLAKLRALVRMKVWPGCYVTVSRPLHKSPAFKYLQGIDTKEYKNYPQAGLPGITNVQRLASIKASVASDGYPGRLGHITLFGDQPYIRDGQHRACVLAHLYGLEATVPVRIIEFYSSSWRVSPVIDSFASWVKSLAKKLRSKYRTHFL